MMTKLPTALLVGAMAMSACALAAEQATPPAPTTSKNCSKLSGKEKDKCVQATPAGPVNMQSGAQQKGKSHVAKQRDRKKEGDQANANAPAQNNDAAGHPQERGPTGQAQTGARTTGNNTPTAKAPPQQSKDTVGRPEERAPTGQAQTGQEPGQNTANRTQ